MVSNIPSAELNCPVENNMAHAPLKKQFNKLTLLSMAFVVCNSWSAISGSVQLALLQGGPITLIYSIITSTTAYVAIAASLAELASVYPTAGGQYHFASILAPPKVQRLLSYSCGLLAIFSWAAIGVSVTIIIAEQLLAIIAANLENFTSKAWWVFLVYQGVALLSFLYNLFALKHAPWTHSIGSFISITLFFISVVIMAIRSHPKQPNAFVWETFINNTGWPDGMCFIIGLSTSCYMYIGIDASMHMAEECNEPERNVPRVIMTAIAIGFLTGFAFTIALLYALADIEEILTTSDWIPYLVNVQVFRSKSIATAIVALMCFMALFITVAVQETSSRLAWAFARDGGMVSSYMNRIHPQLEVPHFALFFTYFIIFIFGFIYIISATAVNALIGSAVILQQLSFLVPIVLLLFRRRSSKFLPTNRPFKLPGLLGWVINIVAAAFITTTFVFFNLPTVMPTSTASANYTCVILGIVFAVGLVNWLVYARKYFNGPTMEISPEL